jgi:micrococcal nuclease
MNKILICALGGVLGLGAAAAAPRKPSPPLSPQILNGTVSRVVDGDTLWLKTDAASEPLVVRIEGIDAPESCQVGGAQATAALTERALGRSVTVRVVAKDAWGRSIGKVFDGEQDLGERMVRDGNAWSTRYRYDRGPYVAAERMAQALKRGLHAAGGAIAPHDFRQQHGPCEVSAPAPHGAALLPATPSTTRQ